MNQQEAFSINAYSCTILENGVGHSNLLESREFTIPRYQRPYSWKEPEIRKLLGDITSCYLNNKDEPYFLGTMQIAPKIHEKYDIIDGQQRLTTLLLLFKAIELRFGKQVLPIKIQNHDWLRTFVNKGVQQLSLDEALILKEYKEAHDSINNFTNCLSIITDILNEPIGQDTNYENIINDNFLKYITTKLYIVVVETRASLAKTIQIFNTINNTGLDLNGSDIFKIQLFDFLTRVNHMDDNSAFDEIDALYSKVEEVNKILNYHGVEIAESYYIYKCILIEQCQLNRSLHDRSAETFYERFFGVVISNENHDHFIKDKVQIGANNDLIKDLNRIIEMKYLWEQSLSNHHEVLLNIANQTRYGRYRILDIIYLFKFYDEQSFSLQQFEVFNESLTKYFTIKTIQYKKSVYEVHSFIHDLIRLIINPSSTISSVQNFICAKLLEQNRNEIQNKIINGDFFDNYKQRYLVVFLQECLHRKTEWQNNEWQKEFFNSEYDIEHIWPQQPREDIIQLEDWAVNLNSIGNLVLLERGINRSISNKPPIEKWLGYEKSKLGKVTELRKNNIGENWTVSKCSQRSIAGTKVLMDFLFGNDKGANDHSLN